MRRDLPTGTVTFLFTDVEGSTRLLHDLGVDAYARALAEHRRVIRHICDREGGVEVDTQGDAFFFAFATAPGAVSAAAAVSEALASGPIRVRVGLHTGTPLLTEEGFVGEDVHRAARIAAAGHGGQVLVSSTTAPLVEHELHDLGEHRFKDLSAPEHVFQVGDDEFPPLKTLYQTNLPIPQTPFLGREKELGEVLALLARSDVRLLTMTGPGGTGKTRLAAQAAGALADRYPSGVFWVPLAPLHDPELVFESAGQALGAGNDLAAHIADKRMLVVFDNFEQVIEAASGLSDLQAGCPHLELLVTSREPLHLTGEQEYPVPPFAPEEGVGFFLARARAVKPDFEVDEAVPEICRRLDELPLALELAAARVKAFSTEQILSRLEQRLPLLTGGSRDAPERQRALRSAIAWSYDLLAGEEQELFRRLSVFAGGCTLEAAEKVCDADVDTLQSLVDKSLLRFSSDRYWMLETIREYAAEQFAEAGDVEEHERRHADFFLALVQEAEPHLRAGGDQPQWVERLETEHENLRAALSWLLRSGDGERALRFVGALFRFWEIRPRDREATFWLERALEEGEQAPVALRAQALFAAGRMARWRSDLQAAAAKLDEALALFRAAEDHEKTSACLGFLANVLLTLGDPGRAEALSTESVATARNNCDQATLGSALHNRAVVLEGRGDLQSAAENFEEALRLFRALRMRSGVANALVNLGAIELVLGHHERSAHTLSEGLDVASELGESGWKTMALRGLGDHALVAGDLGAARPLLIEALRLARDQDDKQLIVACIKDLAGVAAAEGEVARAMKLAEAALELENAFGVPSSETDRRLWARFMPDPGSNSDVRANSAEVTLEEAVEYALGDGDP